MWSLGLVANDTLLITRRSSSNHATATRATDKAGRKGWWEFDWWVNVENGTVNEGRRLREKLVAG